jgi:ABC-type polysaccharide/polyol phosphate export permease
MSDIAGPARTLTPGWSPTLRDFWKFRVLLKHLVLRDVKVKYQRSVLGFVWTLLNPMFTLLVLWLVFTHVMRVDMARYWAFLVSGYFVWNCTSQCLNASTKILDEHASLSRNVMFPSGILVLSSLLSKTIEFLIELTLVVVLLVVAHHGRLPASFALLPVAIVLQLAITAGLMYPLAVVSVFFRDVQHALPILVTTLFYVTPVFYPATMIPEQARGLFLLNPLAWMLMVYHSILYDGRMPEPWLLGGLAAAAAVLFTIGYLIFKRYQNVCIEIA